MKEKILTSEEIAKSWANIFCFKKGKGQEKGLRSPQIGALHALMAHIEEDEKTGIVVMPTGTGKTETMLSFLVANQCRKVFVIVPSDSLRTQTYKKFKTLGLLRHIGVVPSNINLPIVKMVTKNVTDPEWKTIVNETNVIVTTMTLAAKISPEIRSYLRKNISYLFVDEAHHSKAETWNDFINIFPPSHVLLFTATPFRNDGQKLPGKIIFNFPLKKAQEQHYYEKIDYYPIVEYTIEEADKAIAHKAIEILKKDSDNGYDHIIMARCKNKKRAQEVYKIYQKYPEYSPVIVYSGMKGGIGILKAIKEKKHKIIVCVNMLGEGYDLPQLKIAAIHDDKQSLAVTLQFIGRFTRTNDNKLGRASFITNIVYPPIASEINCLYQNDADWNYILPRISASASNKQQELNDFLNDFKGELNEEISLDNIRPALSAEIYTTISTTSFLHNWKEGISKINAYDYILHSSSNDTLVIVLGKKSHVQWGDTNTVKNLTWDIIIVYFDALHKRIYLNSSLKINGYNFLKHIFSSVNKIQDERVYRVFANINRLRLFNVGARLPQGKDISFQSYFGSSVQDGLDMLTQGKLLKNNIFGIGFKDGCKTSIGCSNNGKIWSRERADLLHFQEWCKEIGRIVTDESIDTNVVLQNTLNFEEMKIFPNVHPISIDWNPEIYERYSQLIHIANAIVPFDDLELVIEPTTKIGENIIFSIQNEEYSCTIKMEFDKNSSKCIYTITAGGPIKFIIGDTEVNANEFFDQYPITIFYADNSISYGRNLCKPKNEASTIPDTLITSLNWEGVDLKKESQKSAPYRTDSIQFYMVQQIKHSYDYLIDDDGKGEIADLVGIKDSPNLIDITLYHLKYAIDGRVSELLDNLYQVCGQAQKSIRWKYLSGDKVFTHILKRNDKKIKQNKSSIILKGTSKDILKLREEATNRKEIRYHVVIVQPGMSKSQCSYEMKILLGITVQVLKQMANIDCNVICSK